MGKEIDFEKLKGSENFHTWKFAMEIFLALKGFADCIVHKPNKTASGTTEEVIYSADTAIEKKKISGAKAYLVLGIETMLYIHIQNCRTALDIWNTLHRLYEDNNNKTTTHMYVFLYVNMSTNVCRNICQYELTTYVTIFDKGSLWLHIEPTTPTVFLSLL